MHGHPVVAEGRSVAGRHGPDAGRHPSGRCPMSRAGTRGKAAAAIAVTALLTSGCGFHGIYSLPLPGGKGTGGPKYRVTVLLADALDLVPRSSVKVNGASVGRDTSIRLQDRHAVVVCEIQRKVHLPANAIARIEQTSLLGEKFVEIEPPHTVKPQGQLTDGSVIPLART